MSFHTLSQTLRGCGGIFTPELLDFFELAGMPRTLLDYLPSILGDDPLKFYSCFISYDTADEQFASGLEHELSNAGVKTWKWDMKAVPGRDLRENIDRAIHSYDKLILVCSSSSLTSPAVEREIERGSVGTGRGATTGGYRRPGAHPAGRHGVQLEVSVR